MDVLPAGKDWYLRRFFMLSGGQVGWFAGRWPPKMAGTKPAVPAEGTAPWHGHDVLHWGDWGRGEVRTLADADSWLAVFGHCLASDSRIRADFTSALRSGHVEPLTRWPGSYAAVFARRRGDGQEELTLLVDLAGQFPIYFAPSGDEVIFASHLLPVGRRLHAQPDIVALGAYLLCPGAREAAEGRAMLVGVRRLHGGQALRVTRSGLTQWTYAELVPHPGLSLAECAEDVRSRLTEAVRLRATSADRLTADFSGGLDSTSLAFLAARDRREPLPVFTYRNTVASVDDDVSHARAFARMDGRFDHFLVEVSEESLFFQDLTASCDEPEMALPVVAGLRYYLGRIAEHGSDVHLSGDAGDLVLGAPHSYLADLAHRGELNTLWRHCRAWAKLGRRSQAGLLAAVVAFAGTSLQAALIKLADSLSSSPGAQASRGTDLGYWSPPGEELAWVTPTARHAVAAHIREKAAASELPEGMGYGDYVTLADLHAAGANRRFLRETAERFGIREHAPFLDNEVVRACLRLPAHRRADVHVAKPLLRKALSGVVPAEVFARRTKGSYNKELYFGARKASRQLREIFSCSASADYGLIEPAPVRKALEKALFGLAVPWAQLNRVLAVELWLRGLDGGGSVNVWPSDSR